MQAPLSRPASTISPGRDRRNGSPRAIAARSKAGRSTVLHLNLVVSRRPRRDYCAPKPSAPAGPADDPPRGSSFTSSCSIDHRSLPTAPIAGQPEATEAGEQHGPGRKLGHPSDGAERQIGRGAITLDVVDMV